MSCDHGDKRTDEITVLEVVAIQLLEGVLRIHYVPEDNIGGSLGLDRNTLSNLTRDS